MNCNLCIFNFDSLVIKGLSSLRLVGKGEGLLLKGGRVGSLEDDLGFFFALDLRFHKDS
jgi:hypothetical protein